MELKKSLDRAKMNGFIKTTDPGKPTVKVLSPQEKVLLNRKANELFNKGDLLKAQQIFLTTGYSDGLIRVGDAYYKQGDKVNALLFYFKAKSADKFLPLMEQAASIIRTLLDEGELNE